MSYAREDEDYELGVEISISPQSNQALQNRYSKDSIGWTNTNDTGSADSSSSSADDRKHHQTSDIWQQSQPHSDLTSIHGTKTPRRKRSLFRQFLYLLLMFCLGGMIAAGVMAFLSKRGSNKNEKTSSLAVSNNNPSAGNRNDTTESSSSPEEVVDESINENENDNEMTPSGAPAAAAGQSDKNSMAPSAVADNFPQTPGPTAVLPSIIRSVKSTYQWGEAVHIFFSFGNDFDAQVDDWIGLYPSSILSPDETPASAFIFSCNRPTICDTALSVGQVTIGNNMTTTDTVIEARLQSWTWPLEPGNYNALLLRGSERPFQIMAQTQTSFVVEPDLFVHSVIPAVKVIEQDIRRTIDQDEALGPKFVRLGFHDCTGGCNGCVDMDFMDNAGLEVPIDALAPIVQQHENRDFGISRADIWVMAALIGADVAQRRSETKVDFSMEFIGRQNCEDVLDECFDQDGMKRPCTTKLGPHVHLPESDITTDELFHFFSDEFGFSVQETVALMGAHTLGSLSRTNSGFDAPNGWVRDNLLLDNDYYHELVGGREGDSLDRLINLAPPWFRFEVDNRDLDGIPNRPAWRAFPPAFDGSGPEEIIMLNADIAIVRELTTDNLRSNGRVSCSFTQALANDSGSPRCPHAQRSLQFAADYKFDNNLWLQDFEKVYKKMLNHGYNYDPNRICPGGMCRYEEGTTRR